MLPLLWPAILSKGMNILPSCRFHAATRCAQVNEICPSDCLVNDETGVNLTHYSLIDKEISEHFSWKLIKFVQKSLNFWGKTGQYVQFFRIYALRA